MVGKLFISYRRSDAAHSAGRLRDVLAGEFPQRVFVDVEDIEPGADFVKTIEASLHSAAAVIAIIGQKWLEGSTSGTKLGDPTDVVTLELRTAIRLGVPILPVLIDGTPMPQRSQLPDGFTTMLSSNAVSIRHASFRRDCDPLIAFAYKSLHLVPPTTLEKMLEWIASKTGYGDRFRIDERMRSLYATAAMLIGTVCFLAAAASLVLPEGPNSFESLSSLLSSALLVVLLGLIGKNSQRGRWRAIVGSVFALLAFAIFVTQAIHGMLLSH